MKLTSLTQIGLVAVAVMVGTTAAHARDRIQIAGSSTVLPYSTIVAERFAQTYSNFKTPVVESGGSGAGLKQFCQGVGPNQLDVANASRAMKSAEKAECVKNGVKDIIEVKFGYDGIVFASDVKGPDFALSPVAIFSALADKVVKDGKLVSNPNKSWKEINPYFPDWKITAFIPGEKHGTREVFEEKILAKGCEISGALVLYISGGMDPKAAAKACLKVRGDGASVDIDGDYTETLGRLQSNKQAIGVFGLSFYENNTDKLKVATVDGITPSVSAIAAGEYPVSRPLFFYVKKAHIGVIPGLQEYTTFFLSEQIAGPDGPLAEYGLVPLPANELQEVQQTIANGKTM